MIAVSPQKYVRIIPWVSLQLLFVGAMSLIAGGRQWLSRHVITVRKRKRPCRDNRNDFPNKKRSIKS